MLPDNLERLKHISIDTLDLSESTSALLKWNGLTHVLDCIAFFHYSAHGAGDPWPWPRYITLLFDEVRPKLIATGDWNLVLDADAQRVIEQSYELPNGRVVHWQGRDIDLNEIPFEQLGLSDVPYIVRGFFKSVGDCLDHFLHLLTSDSEYWLEIDIYNDHYKEAEPGREFDEYIWGAVQPRLFEMGYWLFVEAHIDDFEDDEDENDFRNFIEDDDGDQNDWDDIDWGDIDRDDGDDEE